MIQAYIIKAWETEAYYNPTDDILYRSLDKAIAASKEWNGKVYYLLIELVDREQILQAIFAAANGQSFTKFSYKILESIVITKEG